MNYQNNIQSNYSQEKHEVLNATDLVTKFLENLGCQNVESGNKILTAWKAIIESIKPNAKTKNAENLGKNLASHSRIIDFKNGILLVEADHSSWLQMLQLYQRYILGSLQRRFPELHIATLAFRLRGSNVGLSVGYDESLRIERERQNARYEREEKYLAEKGFSQKVDDEKIPELPPELKLLFDKMRQDMLTNGERI